MPSWSRSSNARSKPRANLLYAEQQFARKSKLATDGFAPPQDLDEATADVAPPIPSSPRPRKPTRPRIWANPRGARRRRCQVKSAEAAVGVIAARAVKLRVRAPADGTVALLVAEPGEAIIPGQQS